MSEDNNPWIKKNRYFCKVCSSWMENNTRAIRLHESGKKHIANAEKYRTSAHADKKKMDAEESKHRKIFEEIERKAAASYAHDTIGEAPPAHLYSSSHVRKPQNKHVPRETPAPDAALAPVPVSSGCYLGHDQVFYFYDVTTKAYTAVDAEWVQSYIATNGILQFAVPGAETSSTAPTQATAAETGIHHEVEVVQQYREGHARSDTAEAGEPSQWVAVPRTGVHVQTNSAVTEKESKSSVGTKISAAIKLPPGLKRKSPVLPVPVTATAEILPHASDPTKSTKSVVLEEYSGEITGKDRECTSTVDIGAWEEVVAEPKPVQQNELTRTTFGGSSLVKGSIQHVAINNVATNSQALTETTVKVEVEDSDDDLVVFKKKKRFF